MDNLNLHFGDNRSILPTLEENSVDCVFTSPPYWGLRDYGTGPDQLGLEPTWQLFIKHMVEISSLIKRVLKPTGSYYLVMGDTYAGSGGAGGDYNPGGMREGQPKYKQNHYRDAVTRPKQLLLIPSRLAIALQEDGWILRNDIIWYKPNHMPSSVKDRLTNSFEHVFHFVKSNKPYYWHNSRTAELTYTKPKESFYADCSNCSGTGMIKAFEDGTPGTVDCPECNGKGKVKIWHGHCYYYDLDSIREPHKEGVVRWGGNTMKVPKKQKDLQGLAGGLLDEERAWRNPKGKNPGDTVIPRHPKGDPTIHGQRLPPQANQPGAFHPAGKNPGDIFQENIDKGIGPTNARHRLYPIGRSCGEHDLGKNPSDFFRSNTKPYPEAHFAVFPEDICIPRIKSSTPKEVCVSCGKARERITETSTSKRQETRPARDDPMGRGSITTRGGDSLHFTIGWTKCDCNKDFEPGIVLDPFAGSGTTGKVALDLGRKAILIEINEDYRELIERRLSVHNPEWLEKYAIQDAKENGIIPLTEFD